MTFGAPAGRAQSCEVDGLHVFGLDQEGFQRFALAIRQMERGRSEEIQHALDDLSATTTAGDALSSLHLALAFARQREDLEAIAAFRTRQSADPLAARFANSERLLHEGDGPLPSGSWASAGEGAHGLTACRGYMSIWKLASGRHVFEKALEGAGPVVVVEGLFKKHVGDDDACIIEVESEAGITRVGLGGTFFTLDTDAQALRLTMTPRFVAFRLAVLPRESWLFVDGLGAVRSTHVPHSAVRAVRFGVQSGARSLDANSFWSSLRLLWSAPGALMPHEIAPVAGLEEQLSNIAVVWAAAGRRPRALETMVTAVEVRPTPAVLENLARLAHRLGEDVDPFNPRLEHALGLAGAHATALPITPSPAVDRPAGRPEGANLTPFRVLGLDAPAFERMKEVIAHMEGARFEQARIALAKLCDGHPDYPAFRHLLVAVLAALGDESGAIALFRELQGEDRLGHRLAHERRWMTAQGGPSPAYERGLVAATNAGAEAAPDALVVWKQRDGSWFHEVPLEGGGDTVVFEGLVRKTTGDDESCMIEVTWAERRERVVLNTGFLVLKSSGQAARVRPPDRYVPLRLVVDRGESRLYVDGSMVLQSVGLPSSSPVSLRFGLAEGLGGADTGSMWSSLRLAWGRRPRVEPKHLAPFPRYAEHLNNLSVAWMELGSRDRAFHCLAAALDTDPREGILANFEALVDRMAADLDPEDERVRRCLDIVEARAGKERAERLRTLIQQRRHAIAISCRNVSIYFARAPHRVSHPLEIAKRLSNPKRYFERNYWWAVRDVSFDLRYGEVLAVIGNNGSGKSTLLRAIAGILDHQGTLVVNGSPRLLVMGLGIQDELSGRDNVTLGCVYLGLRRREIRARTEEILSFAELTAFADVPYKYYSDGMKARLMFSIATSIEPDILLLDELLGAGDVSFRAKALARMNQLLERSKAMIVVTHNLTFVRERARRALYLDAGSVVYYGSSQKAVDLYLERCGREGRAATREDGYLLEEV